MPEAPASATITVKTPGGFETLVTIRDYEDKELTKKQLAYLLNLDKALLVMGFTPVIRGFGKPAAKPIEYVEGRVCPKCGSKLVHAQTKDGRKFIKCEANKWNFAEKRSEGCTYTDWGDTPQQSSSHDDVPPLTDSDF